MIYFHSNNCLNTYTYVSYSNRHAVFSTVSCWWWSFPTQWWNLGIWLRARCMVRILNKLQICFFVIKTKSITARFPYVFVTFLLFGEFHTYTQLNHVTFMAACAWSRLQSFLCHEITEGVWTSEQFIHIFLTCFEGKCSTWQGKSLPLCLGPAAALWMGSCMYLEAVIELDRPIRWGWNLQSTQLMTPWLWLNISFNI